MITTPKTSTHAGYPSGSPSCSRSSDTPETDAQCENNGIGLPLRSVDADFARKLERERNAMKDPNYKMPAIPYGLLNDMLSNLERQIDQQIERNKNPRDMDESDIPRKAMHGGKYQAHLLDRKKVSDFREKIEHYRECNKIPRGQSPANAKTEGPAA